MTNNKKILIGVLVLAILAAAGFAYYYWIWREPALPSAEDLAKDLSENISKGVLPDMDTSEIISGVADSISNTNPFSDMKTNPFK